MGLFFVNCAELVATACMLHATVRMGRVLWMRFRGKAHFKRDMDIVGMMSFATLALLAFAQLVYPA